MGEFFNRTLKSAHKIPETKIGLGNPGLNSETEKLRREFNKSKEPIPEVEPILEMSDYEKKVARMAKAREVQRQKRLARQAKA